MLFYQQRRGSKYITADVASIDYFKCKDMNISTWLGITMHILDPRIFPGAVRIKAWSKGLQKTRSINSLSSVIFIFYF